MIGESQVGTFDDYAGRANGDYESTIRTLRLVSQCFDARWTVTVIYTYTWGVFGHVASW